MSYRAGIGGRLAELLGMEAGPPRIRCDAKDCEVRIDIDGDPPRWFLARKPKPGWSLDRTENADGSVTRVDLCPLHRAPRRKGRK